MRVRFSIAVVCIALAGGLLSASADEAAIDLDIVVAPNVLSLHSLSNWVTIHTNIAYSAVAGCQVAADGADVPVAWTKADARGNLVVKLRQADVKAVVSPPAATFVLTGTTKSDVDFIGSDSIRVIP